MFFLNSIAILGASNDREKFGNKAVRAYLEAGWRVYPVNPREKEIEGVECFPSVESIPEPPEMVSVYLPPEKTIPLVASLAKAGVKKAILNPGAESEALISVLKEHEIVPLMVCSIRMIGKSPDSFRP